MTSNGGISNGVSNGSTLGTSIDSALVPSPNTYPKNRFLSGDLNSNAYLRRQFISIGKYTLIFLEHFEKKINIIPKDLIDDFMRCIILIDVTHGHNYIL